MESSSFRKKFKAEAKIHGIKLIFGKPYHSRGRGKIERYHQTLYRELIAIKEFRSLSHFRRELWNFDNLYNNWRKQEILNWMTPASVYNNKINFKKDRKLIKSGQKLCQQNGH
jgi:transposase InsO family protein